MTKINLTLRRLARDYCIFEAKAWANDLPGFISMVLKELGADKYEQLWRVEYKAKGPISVVCVDLPVNDLSDTEIMFDSWDKTPQWLQDRVRMLSMITGKPPTNWVDGIGRRMSEDIYWVVK